MDLGQIVGGKHGALVFWVMNKRVQVRTKDST